MRVSNHKWGIPCHPPSPPQTLSLSSFGGVCVLGGDASVCSPFREERGRLHTLLCGLGKRKEKCNYNSDTFPDHSLSLKLERKNLGMQKKYTSTQKYHITSTTSSIQKHCNLCRANFGCFLIEKNVTSFLPNNHKQQISASINSYSKQTDKMLSQTVPRWTPTT